jgi:uncharacterized damage-inducible protein DinB
METGSFGVSIKKLLLDYKNGPIVLSSVLSGMTPEQFDAAPVPGKWSTRQVICHLTDAELLYADRFKRILAEDQPRLMAMDPDVYVAKLAVSERDLSVELDTIDAVRRHMVGILEHMPEADFQRTGIHSADGPLTLQTLLERITRHIPHHARKIVDKRRALGLNIEIAGL